MRQRIQPLAALPRTYKPPAAAKARPKYRYRFWGLYSGLFNHTGLLYYLRGNACGPARYTKRVPEAGSNGNATIPPIDLSHALDNLILPTPTLTCPFQNVKRPCLFVEPT